MDQKINLWSMDIDDESKEFALSSAVLGSASWSEYGFRADADGNVGWAFDDGTSADATSTEFKVIPLSHMLSELSEDEVKDGLSTYRARSATAFGVKLQKDAIRLERSGRCRTYLAMVPSGNIIGYVMLGMGTVNIPEGNCLSKRVFRRLGLDDGYGTVPTFMLAQISWSLDSPDGFEHALLMLAHDLLIRSRDVVGGRLVMIECGEDQEEVLEERGFHTIGGDGDLSRYMVARI